MPRKRKLPEGMYQRGRHYYADFYAGGRRVRKRLATDLDAAKQILVELRSRANKADFDLLDNDYPLDKLREQYLRHCQQCLGELSEVRYRQALDVILPRLPAKNVRQLSAGMVLTFRQERLAEGVCPGSVNYEVAALVRMLRWGVNPAKVIGSNPLAGLKALPHLRPKDGRALEPDEVRRLLEASPPHWRDIWYAYLVTGLRLRELARLTFDDVDGDARELVIRPHKAKGKRERRIPIDDGLWDVLKRVEADRPARKPAATSAFGQPLAGKFSDRHVFVSRNCVPLSRGGVYNAFAHYCERAGIATETFDAEGQPLEHVDVHSLRRTFATDLIVGGTDPKTVQELLGHKTLAMTMKLYAKVRPQNKRQAVGRLSYGKGVTAPAHLVEFPATGAKPVQSGHQSVTGSAAQA
ncbi:MAG TPA: tyrosine-type recombinase/integrase [Gemmataceae bacterium]|nr:tyrosine-type recombinase/integrase [Gemmataceae bacterium]